MIKYCVTALAFFPGALSAALPESCMWSDDLDASLVDWHGERVTSESADGRFAFWLNDDSGTWTVVEYHPSGEACVLGYGSEWPPADDQRAVLAKFAT